MDFVVFANAVAIQDVSVLDAIADVQTLTYSHAHATTMDTTTTKHSVSSIPPAPPSAAARGAGSYPTRQSAVGQCFL